MRAFLIGLQFLTRISLVHQENWTVEDFGRSVKYFPLIGVVLGAIYAAAAWLLFVFLPQQAVFFPPHVAAVCLLIMPILLTGGLHCDGFMDTMDGVFSGRSRERMLEIMKDSRVGSNGVFSFTILMLFEWAMILDMKPEFLVTAAFVMPVIARLMMVAAIDLFPYARPEGMGKAFNQYANHQTLLFAAAVTAVFVLPVGGGLAAAALCSCGLFTSFFAHYVKKRLGGLTGDVYGAVTTLNEAVVWLTFLVGSVAIACRIG